MTDTNRALLKCTTVGVPNAASCCSEPPKSATSAITTNISPVSAPADDPRMT